MSDIFMCLKVWVLPDAVVNVNIYMSWLIDFLML